LAREFLELMVSYAYRHVTGSDVFRGGNWEGLWLTFTFAFQLSQSKSRSSMWSLASRMKAYSENWRDVQIKGSNPWQGRPLHIWMYTPSAVSILVYGYQSVLYKSTHLIVHFTHSSTTVIFCTKTPQTHTHMFTHRCIN
jgi:hypothetical protein